MFDHCRGQRIRICDGTEVVEQTPRGGLMKTINVTLTDQELEMMLHESISQEWIEDDIKIIVSREV